MLVSWRISLPFALALAPLACKARIPGAKVKDEAAVEAGAKSDSALNDTPSGL
jgi:hypothetical protein